MNWATCVNCVNQIQNKQIYLIVLSMSPTSFHNVANLIGVIKSMISPVKLKIWSTSLMIHEY